MGENHSPKVDWPKAGAELDFTGTVQNVQLSVSSQKQAMGTRLVFDRMRIALPSGFSFGDKARIILRNNSVGSVDSPSITADRCGFELYSGSTFSASGYCYFCNNAEFVLDGGSVTSAGWLYWAGTDASLPNGRVIFRPGGGYFAAPGGHNGKSYHTTPFEFVYVLPGDKWTGYDQAPARPGAVNNDHRFGNGTTFRANVQFGESKPIRSSELKLIEMCDSTKISSTNHFSFVAFGDTLEINERNGKGEYFYWTYDRSEATEPATPGTLPTGLRFHYAGRSPGGIIRLR